MLLSEQIIFHLIPFQMPKHFRQCTFCANNTTVSPEKVIFATTEHILSVLNVHSAHDLYICEDHFSSTDVRAHGTTKRLVEGSIPVHFPKKEAVLLDHCYVSTEPLNLVSNFHFYVHLLLLLKSSLIFNTVNIKIIYVTRHNLNHHK